MAAFEYLKMNRSYLTDGKFFKLPDNSKWHYWGCYLLAGEAKAEGIIAQNDIPLTIEEMADVLRCDINELKKSINLFLEKKLMGFENGYYFVVRFLEEQGPGSKPNVTDKMREYWAEAQKKHREKINNNSNKNKNKNKEEELNKNKEKEQEEELRIRIRSEVDMSMTENNEENFTDESQEEKDNGLPF